MQKAVFKKDVTPGSLTPRGSLTAPSDATEQSDDGSLPSSQEMFVGTGFLSGQLLPVPGFSKQVAWKPAHLCVLGGLGVEGVFIISSWSFGIGSINIDCFLLLLFGPLYHIPVN